MGLMGHLFVLISECNVAIKRRQKKACFHFAERKQLRKRKKSLFKRLHLKRSVLDAYRVFLSRFLDAKVRSLEISTKFLV